MQTQAQHTHVVVGLGKTGLSCARHLRRQNLPFVAVDTRAEPPGIDEFRREFPDVRTECGELNADTLCSAHTLVMSPGVDLRTPAVSKAIARGVQVTGDIDMFAKVANAPIVAITGSNAKSTVVTLVGEMAKEAGLRTVREARYALTQISTDDAIALRAGTGSARSAMPGSCRLTRSRIFSTGPIFSCIGKRLRVGARRIKGEQLRFMFSRKTVDAETVATRCKPTRSICAGAVLC